MLTYYDYSSNGEDETNQVTLPKDVKQISVSYDGGRVSISINNKIIYENISAGNAFEIELD